jgi:hypothetical protein
MRSTSLTILFADMILRHYTALTIHYLCVCVFGLEEMQTRQTWDGGKRPGRENLTKSW